MKTIKKLGLWMDNSMAHVIEFISEPFKIISIESEFTTEEKESTLMKGESHMHNKEQQKQKEYFKKLSEVIANFDEVLLFGPTNAKAELFNILKQNHRFAHIKIEVKESDKLTPNQELAFVRDHFQKIV
ncbi:MAG: hypothetical protein ABI426_01460 [Flavobacterium sp.]